MCGISAIISTTKTARKIAVNSIHELQNRGYDSAGIGYVDNGRFEVHKYASSVNINAIQQLKRNVKFEEPCYITIAHTRWATHGPQTDYNSHPHLSSDGTVMIVHNGIIENFLSLKNELMDSGYTFTSDTDSEVIANLIAREYKQWSCPFKAIDCVNSRMTGTWGIVVMFNNRPHDIFCSRHGSPILVSNSEEMVIIASEQSAFMSMMDNYIVLSNGDVCRASIDAETSKLYVVTRKNYDLQKCVVKKTDSLGSFAHWTLKEIHEQKSIIQGSTNFGGRIKNDRVRLGGLDAKSQNLKEVENLILLGCGTSYYAGLTSINYFRRLCNFNTIQIFDGGEFDVQDVPSKGETAILFLSQSGETKDLHRCIELINKSKLSMITIGVVNVVDSLIAREVDCGCYIHAGKERAVASTKSFTAQVITLSLIALWFAQLHGIKVQLSQRHFRDLRMISPQIIGVIDACEKNLASFVHESYEFSSLFILGKGSMESVAKEGSLKIKEIAYIHAEGFSGSALKHGPFALLGEGVPVILLINDDEYKDKMMNAYEQIKSRKANILVLTDLDEVAMNTGGILYPRNENYSCILCVVILQYFAYLLSCKKEIDPDFPKNLAKVVTVE